MQAYKMGGNLSNLDIDFWGDYEQKWLKIPSFLNSTVILLF